MAAGARLAAPQAAPPSGQPTFPAEVELVVVDAAVTDRQGRPIRGLSASDFTLLEEGEPREISSFEAVEVPEAASEPHEPRARPSVSTNVKEPAATGRTFVIVFDNRNLTRFDAHRAKGAVAQFLETGARAGDRVMLAATEGDAWWSTRMDEGRGELLSLLKRLEGRLVDDLSPEHVTPWEALRIHVYRDEDVAFRVLQRLEKYNAVPADLTGRISRRFVFDNAFLTQRAAQVYQDSLNRNRATLQLLNRILVSLEGSRGRKAVLLVSGGFPHDTTLPEFKQVPESARRSNVVLYFVNARGLEGMPAELTAQFGMAPDARDMGKGGLGGDYLGGTLLRGETASEGAQVLAAESGGFTVKNANDLAEGISRIAAESEAYYLLGTLYKQGGLRSRALSMFRKALEAKPDHEQAAGELAGLAPPADAPDASEGGGLLKKLFGRS